jgi:hypothetical protein
MTRTTLAAALFAAAMAAASHATACDAAPDGAALALLGLPHVPNIPRDMFDTPRTDTGQSTSGTRRS